MSPATERAFDGIWPALLTPLRADLSIDHELFAGHARSLLAAGCGGVTPFGTTGEGPSFAVDERQRAVDALVAGGVATDRILVSTSAAALPDVVALTRHALAIGAHGCLMLPPFYLKGVSDAGIVDSYKYVIDQVADARLKLYLYHIPQVSAVGLSHQVIATLQRQYPSIVVGIKDSQCDQAHSIALAKAFMPALMVYVGNELDLPALGRLGSTGAVSGLANFMPRVVHRLVSQPDAPGTPADLARVTQLLDRLGGYSLTPALKGIMTILGDDASWLRVRPPLVALSAQQLQALRTRIADLQLDQKTD